MKIQKIKVNQHRIGDSKNIHLTYKVIAAYNTTKPYVGQGLTLPELEELIKSGMEVEITEKK